MKGADFFMEKKKKRQLTNAEIDDHIFDYCNVCSASDCTGLIRVEPATEEEDEAYLDLYPYKPPFIPEDVETTEDDETI